VRKEKKIKLDFNNVCHECSFENGQGCSCATGIKRLLGELTTKIKRFYIRKEVLLRIN
jgi:hypothetical protein